jgi:hypothetical protein
MQSETARERRNESRAGSKSMLDIGEGGDRVESFVGSSGNEQRPNDEQTSNRASRQVGLNLRIRICRIYWCMEVRSAMTDRRSGTSREGEDEGARYYYYYLVIR